MIPGRQLRSGAQLVVDQLLSEGVETAFCVPGESYLGVLDALYDSDINLVTCRHEGGAGYMANAYAKITGKVGVCMVTRGPGAANAMIALHAAYQDSVPLVLLVGLIPRGHTHRESFQEFDLNGWFGTTTKNVLHIEQAERGPEIISRAFALAKSGRHGPVVVGLPEDMLRELAATGAAPSIRIVEAAPAGAALDELSRLLAAASRPLVILGGGGWTSEASLFVQEWAERNVLPVAVEFNALDLIDHESPSYIGTLGYGRSEQTAEALSGADLVIGIGSPLGDVSTDSWKLLPVGQTGTDVVTILPDADGRGSAHLNALRIVSSVPAVAAALNQLPVPRRAWREYAHNLRRGHEQRRRLEPTGGELDLNVVFDQLQQALPVDAIITWGAGNHAGWAKKYLRWRSYPTLLAPRNGSMGYGVPAAVAAAIAHPERQVVSVAGDGCFLMNGQELAVAVAQKVAPVIIVLNNSMYGTIRAHQERYFPFRVSGTDLTNPDFAAFAVAFGGQGEVVESTAEFLPALRRALAAGVPAVVELRLGSTRTSTEATIEQLRLDAARGCADPQPAQLSVLPP